ncbi:MAG: acyl-ACP--UDP-N-acetylglucosamine O-acyltransferase [Arenicellales bacterium]
MSLIDERAVIHPGAQIGAGVKVGPFAIIEEQVVIGDGCVIESHAIVRNHTKMGAENHIFQFASVGETPQYKALTPGQSELIMGDRNTIRENVTLNRGTPEHGGVTTIGDDNFIMAYAHIAHDCHVGNQTIFANGASLAGHVNVHDYAILGGFSLVHQFCNIGAHCITGIGAVCFKDVPPYTIAAGNPSEPFGINSRGLRRRDFDKDTILLLKLAYKLLYRSNLDFKSAIAAISSLSPENTELNTFVAFLQSSERGVIRKKGE